MFHQLYQWLNNINELLVLFLIVLHTLFFLISKFVVEHSSVRITRMGVYIILCACGTCLP